jgi:hypothetical protein
MWIVDQLPGFIVGAVVSAVASFFVWRNNKPLMDKIYAQAKSEYDEKEKALRAELEELKMEEKFRAWAVKAGLIKQG